MKDLSGQGGTMIVVTHGIGFARTVAGQVLAGPQQQRTRIFLYQVLNPI